MRERTSLATRKQGRSPSPSLPPSLPLVIASLPPSCDCELVPARKAEILCDTEEWWKVDALSVRPSASALLSVGHSVNEMQ